jgi:hypothetical protein
MATLKILDFGVKYSIKRELEKLADKIKAVKGGNAGVLVVANIKEWDTPDPTGARAKMVYSIHIGGVGNNFRAVYQKYLIQHKLLQGPGEGWRYYGSEYVWVTDNLTQ